MAARRYCQITGIIVLVLGVLGFVWKTPIPNFLSIGEPGEIGLHLVLGVLATYAGFSGGGYGRLAVGYAKIFGIVYLVLGIVGFFRPMLVTGFDLDAGCNLLHLVLGIWGIWAGYFAGQVAPEAAMR